MIKRQRPSQTSQPVAASTLPLRISGYQDRVAARWQALPSRDRLALAILIGFLLLFGGGYGGYLIHQAASSSKAAYEKQVADYFWLRAQAGNIDSSALNSAASDGTEAMPPASQVSTLLNQAGISNAQVAATSDAVQLSFSHPSQAVASTALAQLQQQGFALEQLTMQQDPISKQLEVQASVTF